MTRTSDVRPRSQEEWLEEAVRRAARFNATRTPQDLRRYQESLDALDMAHLREFNIRQVSRMPAEPRRYADPPG